jgi:hypothetical protein
MPISISVVDWRTHWLANYVFDEGSHNFGTVYEVTIQIGTRGAATFTIQITSLIVSTKEIRCILKVLIHFDWMTHWSMLLIVFVPVSFYSSYNMNRKTIRVSTEFRVDRFPYTVVTSVCYTEYTEVTRVYGIQWTLY